MKLPFSKLDHDNIEHLDALCYLRVMENKGFGAEFTLFEDWKLLPIDSKSKSVEFKNMIKELNYLAQFNILDEIKENEEAKELEDNYIEDIANSLIVAGVDANFIMNSSTACLPKLLLALDEAKKQELLNARLWTWWTIRPHISGKSSPEDLMPFPWEHAEQAEQKEKEHAEALSMAEQFLNN